MKIFSLVIRLLTGICIFLFNAGGSTFASTDVNTIVNVMKSSAINSAESQKKISGLSDKTKELYEEYRSTIQEKDSLEIYNKHIIKLIQSQKNELTGLQKQLDEIDVTSHEVVPLLLRMLDSLDKFVNLDVPFLLDERKKRLADLRDMMNRADVTVAEQYRRIMEAYLVELNYGRTIDAYESNISIDGKVRTANFLRIGRIVLAYQTPDKSKMGIWDNKTRRWDSLDSDYESSITNGLRIARRQAAPELLRLPLPSPERIQ